MNIGELTATLGVDTSGLPKAEKEFQKFTKTIEGSTASMNSHLKTQMGIIEEIEDTLEKLNTARKKAFRYDEIVRYNKKIAETKMYLKEYQNAGIEASKAVDSKMSVSKNVVAELSRTITRVATILYGLRGAFEAVKMSISATQGTADEFKIEMAGLSQGVDNFFIAVSSGDWSNFWTGLQTSTRYAMELADTMDKLGDIRRGRAIEEVKLEGESARLLIKIRDTTGKYTITQRQEFYNELVKINKDYQGEILNDAVRERDAILKLYSSITNLPAQKIEDIISTYGINYEKAFDEAGKKLNAAKEKWRSENETMTPYGSVSVGAFNLDEYLAGLSETDRFYTQLQMHFEKLNDSKLDKATASIIGVHKALNATDEMLQKYSKLHNQIFKPEKEKKWENPYQASMNRYGAQLAQMGMDRKLKAPEFEETDYRKQLMMFGDISPMEELSAQLADIAYRNSVFGDSMDQMGIKSQTFADQIGLVTQKMQALWDQGYRPGNAVFDEYTKKLNQLNEAQNRVNKTQEIAAQITGTVLNAFSDISSIEDFGNAIIQTAKSIILAMIAQGTTMAVQKAIANSKTWYGAVIQGGLAAAAVSALFDSLPKMAKGGVVPEGYPNDTYHAMLTSGETVLPPGELPRSNTVVLVGETKIKKGDIYIAWKQHGEHLERVN